MSDHELFGYQLPFPRQDLVVALSAVLLFLPVVVVINYIAEGFFGMFKRSTKPSVKTE
jgi:hypothetical protein